MCRVIVLEFPQYFVWQVDKGIDKYFLYCLRQQFAFHVSSQTHVNEAICRVIQEAF
jgi:hypothetical protein